ncbi:BofC C-terminal domain-containing protein [Paenibacillus naphthalenovorans]|uniref:Bypass of forespore C n=1 Tax=Paenibacillus naphthalenovorans TaxID=162209 RepID=A0A0U2MY43_9BACL|nr:BofC C-terminal domain-containing protein [Paenibacillus naphthalenovorans]ALS23215.1 bypass of forespore C [Paenibacillus naphthalenovorans]
MNLLSFWNQFKKQLKKKLRVRRRWMNLAGFLFVAGTLAAGIWLFSDRLAGPAAWKEQEQAVFGRNMKEFRQPEDEVLKMVAGMDGQREAYMKKAYVCGEEFQRLGMMSSTDILAYHRTHPSYKVSLDEGNKVYFTETVDDLSPQCKENAYFGLDTKGNLSLFEGVPGSGGESIIRTFFQLNIEHLESSLPRETVKQLYRGIRVRDLDDYNSVLSTLSDYAMEETENVLQKSSNR